MLLNSFSPLIQIAVTLNIAFVAIEYIKNYSKVLCNQAFKLSDFVKEKFDNSKLLKDKETLWHILPIDVDGKSTAKMIEASKREWEKLNEEISSKKNLFFSKVEDVGEIKNISSISLCLFLYGLTALFLIGWGDNARIMAFWMCLTILTFLYSVLGWCINDNPHCIFLDFSSLRHSIIWFLFSLMSSIIFCFCCTNYINPLGSWLTRLVVIFSVLFQFSNFVVAVIKVRKQAKKTAKEITTASDEIKSQCDKFNDKITSLLKVNQISEQLKADPIDEIDLIHKS